MKAITKSIKKFEKKHLPKVRHKSFYVATKKAILILPLLLIALILKGIKPIKNTIRKKLLNRPKVKLQNIVNGWYNLTIKNAVVEKIAIERANICAKCPFAEMSNGIYTTVIDNKTTQIRGLKCTQCGCPLSAKVRSSKDYCPIGKW
jgi:hypothetical protein